MFAPHLWIFGLLWIPVALTLIVTDQLAAARAPALVLRAPGIVEVGAPLVVTVEIAHRGAFPRALEVALSTGPRLEPAAGNRIRVDPGELSPAMAFVPLRRGADAIERVWARWTGPLGLAYRQREYPADKQVLVVPDVRPIREQAALLLRDAREGELARIDRGEGSEFESLAEWQSGMDRRTIDWRHSARHFKLLARETRIERNNQIVFAVDAGRVMCEPIGGVPRVDRAISAVLLAAYSALKLGDRVALFGFDSRPRISSGAVTGVRAFPLVQRLAAQLDYSSVETNYTLALATLAGQLNRRSLVVVLTEFTDQTGAELMLRAAANLLGRHLVLFVVLADEELESLAAVEPHGVDDVSKAVTAAALLRERRIVMSRLRHLGIHVLETPWRSLGAAMVRQYLDFKRRNLL
ncbi:MAG: DUF58 domain-containing protein [Sphingomonas sp.]